MLKRALKLITIVLGLALIFSLTLQIVNNPQLSEVALQSKLPNKIEVGDQVKYQTKLKTNWFTHPNSEINFGRSAGKMQIIDQSINLASIGFSSLTWQINYTTVAIEDNFIIDDTKIIATANAIFSKNKKKITIKFKKIQVQPLKENKTAQVKTEGLVKKYQYQNTKQKSNHIALIILALIAILTILFILKKISNKKQTIVLQPWEIARQALNQLEDKFPIAIGPFYVLTTDIIREYIESLYHLPATESTTPEFIKALTNEPLLESQTRKMLANFLNQADMIKFAKQSSSELQMQEALHSIRQLIDETSQKFLKKEEDNA
jgi:DNA-binding cell septation regulator SpoVG